MTAPQGMCGGLPGAKGKNLLLRASDNRIVNLGSKNAILVNKGDRILIMTPGGGGYGSIDNRNEETFRSLN